MRDLHTPFGVFAFDPAALAGALNLSHEARIRDPAPEIGPGFPQIRAKDSRWVRQNIPGGEWWPIADDELRELLGMQDAA